MNARTLVVAALALVGAIVAFMLIRTVLSDAEKSAAENAKPVEVTSQVLISARPLPTGTILKFEDMIWVEWPNRAIISDSFVVEGRGTIEDHIGKVVRLSFGNKEPLNLTKLVARGERGFVAAMLNPSMRAITVSVNVSTGIGGLALPGDRVDVILIHKVIDPNDVPHTVSETILQNVRLLSVDQRSADNSAVGKPGKSVTLEVTPKMVEKIAMLAKLGTLHLSLRALPRGEGALANDLNALPTDAMPTLTWDNEVSALLEPNKDKRELVVRQGDSATIIKFEEKPKEKAQ